MALALLTLTVAQLFDLGTFVRMVADHGVAAEANPLVRVLLVEFGVPMLAVTKLAVLSLVVAVIATIAGRSVPPAHPRAVAVVVTVTVVAGLIGGLSNAQAML